MEGLGFCAPTPAGGTFGTLQYIQVGAALVSPLPGLPLCCLCSAPRVSLPLPLPLCMSLLSPCPAPALLWSGRSLWLKKQIRCVRLAGSSAAMNALEAKPLTHAALPVPCCVPRRCALAIVRCMQCAVCCAWRLLPACLFPRIGFSCNSLPVPAGGPPAHSSRPLPPHRRQPRFPAPARLQWQPERHAPAGLGGRRPVFQRRQLQQGERMSPTHTLLSCSQRLANSLCPSPVPPRPHPPT